MAERNLSPKARFLVDTNAVRGHASTFSTEITRYAIDVALLEYQWRLCRDHPNLDAGAKLAGAHEFVNILLNLGEAPPKTTSLDRKDNLTHA